MTIETIPQRVRRTAREYAKQFFPHWDGPRRRKIQFAYERGNWAARNEFADRLKALADAESDAELCTLADLLLDEYLPEES